MLLAELEVRHSRPIAPTRRVALGELWLPSDPPPGFGGILLAGIVGMFSRQLDEELREGLDQLIDDVEADRRIPQPRLRHRFQTDTVGLDRSWHQLIGTGQNLTLELSHNGSPSAQVLGAVYAGRQLPPDARTLAVQLLRRAAHWIGDEQDELMRYLLRDDPNFSSWREGPADVQWACEILGFTVNGSSPGRNDVLKRFRDLVRDAHPDRGATHEGAGSRITDLTKAKRILISEVV